MLKHKVARQLNLIEDDSDAKDFDTLLAEIKNSNQQVLTNGHKNTKQNLYVSSYENYKPSGQLPVKCDDHGLFNLLTALSNEESKKVNKSKLDARKTVSLDRLTQYTENQECIVKHPEMHTVFSDIYIPPTVQLKTMPSSTESILSASKAIAPNSLSALVDGSEKTSSNIVGKVAALTLADLAKQHKSLRVNGVSQNVSGIKISQEITEKKPSPSSLFAKPSAPQNSDYSYSFHLKDNSDKLDNQNLGKVGDQSSVSSSDVLPTVSTLTGNDKPTLSLSNLAQQHKNSVQRLSESFPKDNVKSGDLSLASLFKNVVIKENKLAHSDKSTAATNSSSTLSNLHNTENNTADFSLAQCLKNKQPNTGSKQPLQCQPEPDIEDVYKFNDEDIITDLSLYDSINTHSDLISQHASGLGFVLSSFKRKRPSENASSILNRVLKYPKFKCSVQVGDREMYPESVYHKIEPFDFSTPSPDDIVKSKQKQAFTRPDKEFEL